MRSITRRDALKILLGSFVLAVFANRRRLFGSLFQAAQQDVLHSTSPNLGAPKLHNFAIVFGDPQLKAQFLLFLTNVYHLYPETEFHALITKVQAEHGTDEAVYDALLAELPSLTPWLADIFYALPSLAKQKRTMRDQTVALLNAGSRFVGYVEIGTPGRYVNALKEQLTLDGPVYLVNHYAPSFAMNDIVERGQVARVGMHVPLANYAPLAVPRGNIALITNYIGLHHAPREQLDAFVTSIRDALAPGGAFILRDHDVQVRDMDAFVGLAHDVFNAGLGHPWNFDAAELRFFMSMAQIEHYLQSMGFRREGPLLAQEGDPTRNLLSLFRKV